MIVNCPACRTRYRYDEPVAEPESRAVCSKCQSVVPLVAAKRTFVVRAHAVAVPVGVPVGVASGVSADLSGPASGMGSLAFGEPAMGASTADVGGMPRETGPAPDPMPDATNLDFGQPVEVPTMTDAAVPVEAPSQNDFDLGAVSPAETATQPTKAPKRAKKARKVRKVRRVGTGRRIVHLLVLLVLSAAGAAGGEYASMVGWLGPIEVHPAVEPVRLGVIGGLLGLLIAWAGIRWTTPKS